MVGNVKLLRGGFVSTEGPVCTSRGDLYFSDVGAERIYCLSGESLRVVRNSSNLANGLTLDRRGRLIVCERGRLTRTERDGRLTILADSYEGKGLHWPNDVAVRSDGTVFFTDLKSKNEWANPAKTGFNAVYRWSERGGLSIFARDCQEPNGVALSHREDLLYVSDTAARNMRVYKSGSAGPQQGRVLAQTSLAGGPDGLKADAAGDIWVCEDDGLKVFSPAGELRATIPIPERPSNCAFSRAGSALFITARTSVYRLDLPLSR